MMRTRRQFIFMLGAGSIALIAPAARASQLTVEVIAMGHSPVQNALKPVREVLGKYAGKVRVVDLDAESPEGEKRLMAVGLKGHIPIALLIDGNKSFKLPGGRSIEFVNFPAAAGNPMGLNGAWTVADFETALRTALGEK